MKYDPPSFRRPQQYDVPGSLDALFNQYQQLQAQKEQSGLQGLALREKYGTDPRGMTPQQLDRGFAGPQITPAVPQGAYPENMVGLPPPARPEQVTFDQDPHVAAIQRHIQARKQTASLGAQEKQAGIENTKADTAYKNAGSWERMNPQIASKGTNRPPPGYRFLPDGDLEAIPGGPAAQKNEAREGIEATAQNAAIEQAQSQIVKVDQALKNVSGWSTGWGGATFGSLPGSQAKDLQGDLDTIKANLGFSTLAEMKRASPSGGALGAISESEMRLLTSARESLDREQSKEQLVRNLNAVKTHYTNWSNAVQKSREQRSGRQPVQGGGEIQTRTLKSGEVVKVRPLGNGQFARVR